MSKQKLIIHNKIASGSFVVKEMVIPIINECNKLSKKELSIIVWKRLKFDDADKWKGPKMPGKETERIGNRWKNREYSDPNSIKIS